MSTKPLVGEVAVLAETTLEGVALRTIRSTVRRVLERERVAGAGVTVLVTDNQRIRKLHRKFLKKNSATDVLAFEAGETLMPDAARYLGDVVVSAQMAGAYCRKNGGDVREEILRYVVHGLLHLLGYDDLTADQKVKMIRRQEQLLKGSAK
ncbi:MAG: rRNA maturation RNase YbeY [Candidatus Omnitrophica bacterium]|nr:rRNA maturation RNase YbeY [Candidatus Omnitrophota bacterium]